MLLIALLLSLLFLPSAAAQPNRQNDPQVATVASLVVPQFLVSQNFPDMTANYQKTVAEPQQAAQAAEKAAQEAAQAALEAQREQEAAQEAQARYAAAADPYKLFIYMHESGNNPGAINASSGACGLGQALPCSKLPCSLSDYACQDAWFTSYAQGYGGWYNAYLFWLAHRWW